MREEVHKTLQQIYRENSSTLGKLALGKWRVICWVHLKYINDIKGESVQCPFSVQY